VISKVSKLTCLMALLAAAACSRPPIGEGMGQAVDPGEVPGDGNDDGGDDGEVIGNDDDDGEVITDEDEDTPLVKDHCEDWTGRDAWAPGYKPTQETTDRVEQTLNSLTLQEKIRQMHGHETPQIFQGDQFSTPNNDQKGVKGFFFRDGPRGVRLFEPEKKEMYATSFPVAVTRAATFDRELERDIGRAIGKETLATGHNVILAPTINTLRHPGWGRGQETYGEDTYVLGKMGTAFTIGAQEYVPACPKHLAGNNVEDSRNTNNAIIDEQTLHEQYLRHFEMTVKEGGAACLMTAYNRLNGPYCSESGVLLDDIIRGMWGYRGITLSDWGAAHSVALAANATLDVEMPNYPVYRNLEQAVNGGQVPVDKINNAVRHILEIKYHYNIDKIGEQGGLKGAERADIASDAHLELAYKAAIEGTTLLKNADNILPLKKDDIGKIAVVGPWSAQPRLGDQGSSDVFPDPARVVPPFQGIRQIAGSGIEVVTSTNASSIGGADVVFVVAALTPADEGEAWNNGGDRPNLEVSADQVQLIKQVGAAHDKVIVILVGGGPITMESWKNDVEGIIMAWYPGEQGGLAIGDLVFGNANFGGHVPMTWPKRWEDEPPFENQQEETVMPFLHGYRYFEDKNIEPLFPFGYGLSYTTFEYSNVRVPCIDVTKEGLVEITVDIKNTGTVAGDTVAFLFVSYPDSNVRRAKKDLKNFVRVNLEPGVKKRVNIPLKVQDLAYWNTDTHKWEVEATEYKVMIGPDAATLPVSDTFIVKN
jgi:beta-glucosidase